MKPDPAQCTHAHLLLIQAERSRVRCRHCHLTIAREELGDRYCPECWQERRRRHRDFEPVNCEGPETVRYRCEICGILLDPR